MEIFNKCKFNSAQAQIFYLSRFVFVGLKAQHRARGDV